MNYDYEHDYELNRHKTSDTVKWVLTLIAFILVGVMFAGIICGWFDKSEDEQTPVTEEQTEEAGGAIISETTGSGVKLASTKIAVADYAEYGISAMAETAYSLTATITPSNATIQDVSWSCAFENPSSSWANGENVADYVSLPNTYSLKNSFSVLQAFSEPVIITVKSVSNPSVSATCKVDYVKRVTNVAFTTRTGETSLTVNPLDGEDNALKVEVTYSGGTVEPTITYSMKTVTGDFRESSASDQLTYVYYSCDDNGEDSTDFLSDKVVATYDNAECIEALVDCEADVKSIYITDILYSACPNHNYWDWDTSVQNKIRNIFYNHFGSHGLAGYHELTYTATFNGTNYGSGTETMNIYYNCSSLSVPVNGLSLNNTHLYV